MQKSAFPPCSRHIFVCVNARDASSAMPCCAAADGEATYAALKREVDGAGLTASVWVTRTGCLGFCNADGATVAIYPEGRFLVSVKPDEAPLVVAEALRRR
jgi:(2Fe-2S) ferredoxin